MINEFNEIILTTDEELNELDSLLLKNIKNEGFVKFFRRFIDDMKLKLEFYGIKFFPERKTEDYKAFFINYNEVNILSLPKEYVNSNVDNKALAIILHEVSHFYHLALAGGMYIAPNLSDKHLIDYSKCQGKFDIEYEAYYRSMVYNQVYDMGIRDEIIEVNKSNLLSVLAGNGMLYRSYTEEELKKLESVVLPGDLIFTGKPINLDNKLTMEVK
jgi:hypothetical protein